MHKLKVPVGNSLQEGIMCTVKNIIMLLANFITMCALLMMWCIVYGCALLQIADLLQKDFGREGGQNSRHNCTCTEIVSQLG